MKAIIFAGGTGTRLWPISRKKSPKQFEKILGNKSTLQMIYSLVNSIISPKDILIATGVNYVALVKKQLPKVPQENIIAEPEKKDVGPAVALISGLLLQKKINEPIIILWSDHYIKKEKKFFKVIKTAEKIINQEKEKIIFIGQKPRFPNQNLGWIELGKIYKKVNGVSVFKFCGFKYRPTLDLAKKFFQSGNYCWNLGYFISTPQFIYQLFQRFSPRIYQLTEKIRQFYQKKDFQKKLTYYYHLMPEINFDNAVLEQLEENFAYVIAEDIGWSDIGAWEALKEALQKKPQDNITLGKVHLENSIDNLVYNYEQKKLIVGIDLKELIVVNTKDALLITTKYSIPKVKKFVESLEKSKNSHLV